MWDYIVIGHDKVNYTSAPRDHNNKVSKVTLPHVVSKQVIHTIEFVLGCVSNTASYLRLWAQPLAHAELSEVFWNFAWMKPLTMDPSSGIYAFVGWAIWAAVTVGVLGIMESLSAFLHALSLQWVEFREQVLIRRWRSVRALRRELPRCKVLISLINIYCMTPVLPPTA